MNEVSEEWRVIPSSPDYEASSLGMIRRAVPHHHFPNAYPAGSLLPLSKTKIPRKIKGQVAEPEIRYQVRLWVESLGRRKRFNVARLVCEAFHGLPPTLAHQAAHNNGNELDNSARNLRWATCKENQADKLLHGTNNNGEAHGMAKITADQVLAIRCALREGASQRSVAARFGISQPNVSLIHTRKAWAHLP